MLNCKVILLMTKKKKNPLDRARQNGSTQIPKSQTLNFESQVSQQPICHTKQNVILEN